MLFAKIKEWIKSLFGHTKETELEELSEVITKEIEPNNKKVTKTYTQEEKAKHQQRIKEIGETGERTSNFKTLPIVVYGKQLRNLYIPTQYGETTEIDTVLISVSGIYVIETKNYYGKIYGKEEQKNWVAWYSEKKKYPFYNPIRQNEAHVIALKSNLHEVNENCFFSIIVFSDKCNIQKIEYDKTKNLIMQQHNLLEEFKELLRENEGKLSRQEVNDIFEKLKKFANASEEIKKKHVANVRNKRKNSYYYDS